LFPAYVILLVCQLLYYYYVLANVFPEQL